MGTLFSRLTRTVSMVHNAEMHLAQYMAETKLTDAAFAALIGRDRTSVMRWRKGETRPDWEALYKIVRETNGAVTPTDFLSPPPMVDGAVSLGEREAAE